MTAGRLSRYVLSVPEAGALVGLCPNTAYKHAREGDFPFKVVDLGYKKVVPISDIERVLGVTLPPRESGEGGEK